jgi:hypothetical protein
MRPEKSTAVQDQGEEQEMAVRPPPSGSKVTGLDQRLPFQSTVHEPGRGVCRKARVRSPGRLSRRSEPHQRPTQLKKETFLTKWTVLASRPACQGPGGR